MGITYLPAAIIAFMLFFGLKASSFIQALLLVSCFIVSGLVMEIIKNHYSEEITQSRK